MEVTWGNGKKKTGKAMNWAGMQAAGQKKAVAADKNRDKHRKAKLIKKSGRVLGLMKGMESDVREFMRSQGGKKMEDEQLHAWAEQKGYDIHEVEDIVESIVSALSGGGKSKGSTLPVDPKELAMGIKVEAEHTNDRAMQEKIARDHLAEFPEYYTNLKKMEDGMKSMSAYDKNGERLSPEALQRKARRNDRAKGRKPRKVRPLPARSGMKSLTENILDLEPLIKAKYLKRWKGADGKWQYKYHDTGKETDAVPDKDAAQDFHDILGHKIFENAHGYSMTVGKTAYDGKTNLILRDPDGKTLETQPISSIKETMGAIKTLTEGIKHHHQIRDQKDAIAKKKGADVSKSLDLQFEREVFLEELHKGRGFPTGTVRTWKGRDYRKDGSGKWIRVEGKGGAAAPGDGKPVGGGDAPSNGLKKYTIVDSQNPSRTTVVHAKDKNEAMDKGASALKTTRITVHEHTGKGSKGGKGSGKGISKHHPMYQRGRDDAKQFGYIPDFKDDDEKRHWEAGYKDGKAVNDALKKKKGKGIVDTVKKVGNAVGDAVVSVSKNDSLGAAGGAAEKSGDAVAPKGGGDANPDFGDIKNPETMTDTHIHNAVNEVKKLGMKKLEKYADLVAQQERTVEKRGPSKSNDAILKQLAVRGSIYRVAQLALEDKTMGKEEIASLVRTGADIEGPKGETDK
jgi:hypothetical protein